MAGPIVNFTEVPQAIQLALGPVFLLTGIAGMLNVMTGRLSRIIDRGRKLSDQPIPDDPKALESFLLELHGLERRRHLASVAITACTLSALLVCTVIAALFIEELVNAPFRGLIGVLFTGATLALVIGLAYFLREVRLATATIRIPIPRLPKQP